MKYEKLSARKVDMDDNSLGNPDRPRLATRRTGD